MFGYKITKTIKSFIEFVGFLENRNIKIIHILFMKFYRNLFEQIISTENLFVAWDEFKKGKRDKSDVMAFEWRLEENIFKLHRELKNKTYKHSSYSGFYIRDPKQRHIHKATVRDRVLHHAIFSILNPIFEETFTPTSFSCRVGYGVHKGVQMLEKTLQKVAKNGTTDCYVLKCDVRKFFDTVNHGILMSIFRRRIKDVDTLWLLEEIVSSYVTERERERERERESWWAVARRGIPIGNLTSQLFANIYMNEFDQFVKHKLKVKNYFRYTDDFVIVANDRDYLHGILPIVKTFLKEKLKLELHPKKVSIRKFHQGVDFLGYVIFPKYRILRSKTRRRIFKKLRRKVSDRRLGKITEQTLEQSLQSYLGVLSHANAYKLGESLKNEFWMG